MTMTAVSVLAVCFLGFAIWNILQRGKLEEQLASVYDALSAKGRECDALKENYESVCRRCERVYVDLEERETELAETRKALEETRQRTDAVQNALREVQNIWNYTGNSDGQQEVG